MWAITRRVTPFKWLACKSLGLLWRNVCLSNFGGLRLEQTAVPSLPDQDWVLCKTRLGGICGTDLGIVFLQQHPTTLVQRFMSWPMVLGHENVAQVERVGSNVASVRFGDRVVVDPPLGCLARKITPVCRPCEAGRPSICENLDRGALPAGLGLGYNNFTGGSWSECFVAHTSQLHKVPDALGDTEAIFVDPLACGLHAILEDVPGPDERILIFGAGMIALSILALIKTLQLGRDVTATAKYPFQAETMRRLGADHVVFWQHDRLKSMRQLAELAGGRILSTSCGLHFSQGGFDRIYDCSGVPARFADASRLARAGGTLILVGTPQIAMTDLASIWFHELKVKGVTGRAYQLMPGQDAPKHNYQHVLDLLTQARLDVGAFKLSCYRQRDYRKALLDLRHRGKTRTVKGAFDFR
jgi:threonine dehydrogenase-like Zn-dependent dehydrogenase